MACHFEEMEGNEMQKTLIIFVSTLVLFMSCRNSTNDTKPEPYTDGIPTATDTELAEAREFGVPTTNGGFHGYIYNGQFIAESHKLNLF